MSERSPRAALAVSDQSGVDSWFDDLPSDVQSNVLWIGDAEEGTLFDWNYDGYEYPGGGVFNTGEPDVAASVTNEMAHSGTYAVETRIRRAIRSRNGDRAVRLMRWTNAPWDDGGEYFPRDAYFSVWMYFPERYNPNKYEPWDPGDGGWWNVLQFKSDDENGVSQPIWVLNVDHDDDTGGMSFYLHTKYNPRGSYGQSKPLSIPVARWLHVEVYYSQASDARGSIIVWQDGKRILSAENVVTKLAEPIHWGIGNYTDHVAGGRLEGDATIYFDDAAVSSVPLHPYR